MPKYFIQPLGCAMNISDAERIASVLDTLGFVQVDTDKDADLVIVVACSVRQTAIDRIYGKIQQWKQRKESGERLVTALSGCVLPHDKKKLENIFDIFFNVKEVMSLSEKLLPFFTNIKKSTIDVTDYLSIMPKYTSPYQSYIPISTGCNNFCTYCAVPYTRGREVSRPMEDVLDEVKRCVKNGTKIITLLGQNVNSYGLDLEKRRSYEIGIKNHFVELLQRVDEIEGDFWVFFTSNHPKDVNDELVQVMERGEKLCHYLHLPIQSGDNQILKKMNRHYSREQYLDLVERIYKIMPDVTLTTDIIVGFPGETHKQFEKTKEVCKKAMYDMAFIAKYSPRPGSYAAENFKDDVLYEEKKRREIELTEIVEKTALEKNKKLEGKMVKVFVECFERGRWVARTQGYKKVVFDESFNEKLEEGCFVDAKIKKAHAWILEGSL